VKISFITTLIYFVLDSRIPLGQLAFFLNELTIESEIFIRPVGSKTMSNIAGQDMITEIVCLDEDNWIFTTSYILCK
jgi:hypothetical protein